MIKKKVLRKGIFVSIYIIAIIWITYIILSALSFDPESNLALTILLQITIMAIGIIGVLYIADDYFGFRELIESLKGFFLLVFLLLIIIISSIILNNIFGEPSYWHITTWLILLTIIIIVIIIGIIYLHSLEED